MQMMYLNQDIQYSGIYALSFSKGSDSQMAKYHTTHVCTVSRELVEASHCTRSTRRTTATTKQFPANNLVSWTPVKWITQVTIWTTQNNIEGQDLMLSPLMTSAKLSASILKRMFPVVPSTSPVGLYCHLMAKCWFWRIQPERADELL